MWDLGPTSEDDKLLEAYKKGESEQCCDCPEPHLRGLQAVAKMVETEVELKTTEALGKVDVSRLSLIADLASILSSFVGYEIRDGRELRPQIKEVCKKIQLVLRDAGYTDTNMVGWPQRPGSPIKYEIVKEE